MEVNLINILDLFRYILGFLAAELVFVDYSCQRKEKFRIKILLGIFALLALGMTFFPIESCFKDNTVTSIIIGIWWILYGLATLPLLSICYEIDRGVLLFYYILATILQEIITLIIRYLIVGIWMPELPAEHTLLYGLLMIGIYLAILAPIYRFLAPKLVIGEEVQFFNQPFMIRMEILIILIFILMDDFTRALWSWAIEQVSYGKTEFFTKYILPYYFTILLLIVSVIIMIFMILIYRLMVLHQNQLLMESLQKQKEQQYEASRENIEIINQKCHDLKHQIMAMKYASDEEKDALYQETKQAVNIYDAAIHTGNEVIDTILTEKGLICSAHDIRLSCNVAAEQLDFINVVDMYTILGNSLDNAIEAVLKYPEEKRVISFWIKQQGQMIVIMVDNYFEGKLILKNGYPVTSKADKNYHGFGIRSIRMVTKKYKGDMRINQDGNTFSMQIMIPVQKTDGKAV